MQDPEVPREVDHQALDAYLAFRWVPAPRPPTGTCASCRPRAPWCSRTGTRRVERYWRLDYARKRPSPRTESCTRRSARQIRAATRRRLISDVPLGAFLSGGVDSAAVVAAMAEASSAARQDVLDRLHHERYNELPLARRVAERFGTDHHELIVEPDALEIIPPHGAPLRRAVRRLVGHPDASTSPRWPAGT